VFDSDRSGNLDVFVMRTNGTSPHQLTNDPDEDHGPSFSPDGRSIAFASDRDGVSPGVDDIPRMRTDGSHEANLSRSPTVFEFDSEWQTR
jgi:TolB protein